MKFVDLNERGNHLGDLRVGKNCVKINIKEGFHDVDWMDLAR
jgi:hypothetical protein